MYNYKELADEKIEYITVASVDELDNGERMIFEIDGSPIALFNIAGEYFAIADICSHDEGPLVEGDVQAYEVECPRHGARFNIKTGQALTLPAVVDIPSYPVRLEGDEIQIGLPLSD